MRSRSFNVRTCFKGNAIWEKILLKENNDCTNNKKHCWGSNTGDKLRTELNESTKWNE
jgi:hypothetical protein